MKRMIKSVEDIIKPKVSFIMKISLDIDENTSIESSINDRIKKIPHDKYARYQTPSKETIEYYDFINKLTDDFENLLDLHVQESRPSNYSNTSFYYTLMLKSQNSPIFFDVRIVFELRVSDHTQSEDRAERSRHANRSFNPEILKQFNDGKFPIIPDELSINILDNEFDDYDQARKFIVFTVKSWMNDEMNKLGD